MGQIKPHLGKQLFKGNFLPFEEPQHPFLCHQKVDQVSPLVGLHFAAGDGKNRPVRESLPPLDHPEYRQLLRQMAVPETGQPLDVGKVGLSIMGILVGNIVLAFLAKGVENLGHTQHIHRSVVEKVQLGIGFHHIVVDGGPAHQQLVLEGVKAGDGGFGQPPHLLTGLQGGRVLCFIVDKEQFLIGKLHDFLDMPLVILHPSQGDQDKVTGVNPPQVLWGADDLVGDLVLYQKGRPGGLDGNGGGDHKDIIGILR